MVVDAFVIHSMDFEPGDASVLLQPTGYISNDVLDEDRIVVSLHGHVTFICPLQKWVDRRRSGPFCQLDQLLNPDQLWLASRSRNASHVDCDESSLVVSSVITDCFAARAQTRDRNADT